MIWQIDCVSLALYHFSLLDVSVSSPKPNVKPCVLDAMLQCHFTNVSVGQFFHLKWI